jgi:hypothetical protein
VNRLVLRGGLGALLLAASACALNFDSTQLGVPVSLAEAAQAPPQGTRFQVTKHPVFLLWGGVTASPPNLEDILAGQVGTGGRIANLRIRIRSRWPDLLVTVLSAGLISPRSVTFDGVVVSEPAAPPAP